MRIFSVVLAILCLVSCTPPTAAYRDEFDGYGYDATPVGGRDISGLRRADAEDEIERAYLNGKLTAAQAWRAHIALDAREHQTRAQMGVIAREREAKQDAYQTSQENISVVRDAAWAGASVAHSVQSIVNSAKNLGTGGW